MATKIGKLISVIAPKVFKIVKNLKSKEGGEGKINVKKIFQDGSIDLFRLALVVVVLLAVLGVITWDDVDKAFEYLGP